MAERATFLGSCAEGARGLRKVTRLVFPLYLANLAVALFAVLPLYASLHRITAMRPAAGRLLVSWDVEILAELAQDHPSLLAELQAVFLFVPLAYLVLSQALLGGVLGALARPDRPRLTTFGADALGHFLPLLWVLLWAALPYGLSAWVTYQGYSLFTDSSVAVRVLALLPGLALLAWTDAALDFGRALRILTPDRSAIRCLLSGFLLVVRRPLAGLGLHLGFALVGLAPLALLFAVPDALDAGGKAAVLLAFLARQIVLLARVPLRVAALGAHLAFTRGSHPVAPTVPDVDP